MGDVVAAAADWAASSGPPNAVFVVALLTAPWRWSKWARDRVGAFLPGGDE